EGAAPSIWFPSIQLRFAGLAEASPVSLRPAQKEAADIALPTAKRQKACHRPSSSNRSNGMPAARALLARSSYFALDCF
ncbi:MAG TPA: hypothetical protein VKB24_02315, partial [Candidatus Acidoferrum sp.]|nr:hypothetical protein [Candidatus Acidoferrum sp.]